VADRPTSDPVGSKVDLELVRMALQAKNIESRAVIVSMYLQPLSGGLPVDAGGVAQDLYLKRFCLSSGLNLTEDDPGRAVSPFLASVPSAVA
jgi:hypothetical protein